MPPQALSPSASSSTMSTLPANARVVKEETTTSDQPQHQFVREKLESTQQTINHTYESVKNSASIISWAFSKVENVASYATPIVTPVTNAVVNNIGNPLLNKVDGVVGAVHDKVFPGQATTTVTAQLSIVELAAREKIKLAVDEAWFLHVDQIISRGFDIKHSFTVFYHAGVESYRVVYDGTKDGVVTYDAFLARFQKTLHKAWETRLAVASKTFYNKVDQNFHQFQPVKNQLKKIPHAQLFAGVKEELLQHELHIIQAFREQLGSPSAYVYNSSVEVFLQVGPNASPNTFVNGVKTRLGNSWSDSLELPIAEFYEGAKLIPTEDLIKFTKTIGLRGWTFGDVMNVFSTCREMTSEEITNKYQSLLATGQSIIDYVIPDKSGDKDGDNKNLSLTGVALSVPTRVADRVVTGVKQGSENLAPLIHVDLVQFGENVIASTKNKASATSEQLTEALSKLRIAMDEMKSVAIKTTGLDVAAEKVTGTVSAVTETVTAPIKTRVNAVTTAVDETVTPYTNQMKDRLNNVAATAKELKEHSADYITNAEIRQFPSDTMSFLAQTPSLVLPTNQDQSESVVKVQQLLSAIKDVFIWSGNWKETPAAAPASGTPVSPAK